MNQLNQSTEGHVTIMGPTGTGKSLNVGLIAYQLCRLGYSVFTIGCKSYDPVLHASITVLRAHRRGLP